MSHVIRWMTDTRMADVQIWKRQNLRPNPLVRRRRCLTRMTENEGTSYWTPYLRHQKMSFPLFSLLDPFKGTQKSKNFNLCNTQMKRYWSIGHECQVVFPNTGLRMAISNFYAKLRVAVLWARPGQGFAAKISTPAGSIFGQSLALKPSMLVHLATKFETVTLRPFCGGNKLKIKDYDTES